MMLVLKVLLGKFNRDGIFIILEIKLPNKIENENGENVKETTTRPKSRKQLKATNGSLIQLKNLASDGILQVAP